MMVLSSAPPPSLISSGDATKSVGLMQYACTLVGDRDRGAVVAPSLLF